ncbi:MAG TPA: glycine zipper 2TM domain-containing protein [Burkholderiales bacterium]|nr:glycine zipper 2TM domain-containing protein [Burkholderiales bacterium]
MKPTIVILSSLALAAGAAQAQDSEDWARVRGVTPQYEQVNNPQQECRTEYVPVSAPPSYAGPVIGGIAGGLLGSAFGKGNGKVAAAAAGAVVGSVVGANVQGSQAQAAGGTQPVQRCAAVDHWENRLSGYQVVYEYAGRSYQTLLPYDPGPRMRVRVSVEPIAAAPPPGRYEN